MRRIQHRPQTLCGHFDLPCPPSKPRSVDGLSRAALDSAGALASALPVELWQDIITKLGPKHAVSLRQVNRFFLHAYSDALPDAFCTTVLREVRDGSQLVPMSTVRQMLPRARTLDAYDERLMALPLTPQVQALYDWRPAIGTRLSRTKHLVHLGTNLRTLSLDLASCGALFDRPGRLPTVERLCLLLGAQWEARFAANRQALLPRPAYPGANIRELSLSFHPIYSLAQPTAPAYAWVAQSFAATPLRAFNLYVPGGNEDAFAAAHDGLADFAALAGLERFALQIAPSEDGERVRYEDAIDLLRAVWAKCHANLQSVACESPNHAGFSGYFAEYADVLGEFSWPKLHTVYLAGSAAPASRPSALEDAALFPRLRTVVLPNTVSNANLLESFGKRRNKSLQHLAISVAVPRLRAIRGDRNNNLAVFDSLVATLGYAQQAAQVKKGHMPDWAHGQLEVFAFEQRCTQASHEHDPASFACAHANLLVHAHRPQVDFFAPSV